MDSLQTKIKDHPNVIQYGVDILTEKLYDIIYKVLDELEMTNDFSTTERDFVERHVLEKYMEKFRDLPRFEEIGRKIAICLPKCLLSVIILADGAYLENTQNLVIRIDNNGIRCIGGSSSDSVDGEPVPLTEEQKAFCEKLDIKYM